MKQIISVFFLCLIGMASIPSSANESDQTYTFGIVPQYEARKIHHIWRPILDLVENKTGYKLIIQGAPSILEFEKEFSSGKFDFAYMNPYHILLANKNAGYLPLLRDDATRVAGVLVVRKDSGITDPRQLNGQTIAFPSPNALGASLLMRADLQDKYGIHISPKYYKTHDSVYLNVLLGKLIAGSGVIETLNLQKDEYKNMLNVIHTTQEVAPHPIVVSPDVPESVRQNIQNAFLEIGKTDAGQKLLADIPIQKITIATMNDYRALALMKLERFYVAPHH